MKNKLLLIIALVFVIAISSMLFFLSRQASDNNTASNQSPMEVVEVTAFNKLGGGTIDLKDYVGEKPVILVFWASWCPYCQKSMPVLSKLYEKYKDQIEIIGVNMQETEQTAQNFIDDYDILYPIVMDPDSRISNEFGITYTNVHVLINIDGSVNRTIPGDIQESDIQSLL
jgi:thiol-disulfide isomerase/thioredoxin